MQPALSLHDERFSEYRMHDKHRPAIDAFIPL